MARPLEFIRLIDGRLWHVAAGSDEAVCGVGVRRAGDKEPEVATEQVPSGAWVCLRCVLEERRRAAAATKAALADPRRRGRSDLELGDEEAS